MKNFTLALVVIILTTTTPILFGATFNLIITDLGGGKTQVLATNISGNIRGYCVFETSTNLVTWEPVVTN